MPVTTMSSLDPSAVAVVAPSCAARGASSEPGCALVAGALLSSPPPTTCAAAGVARHNAIAPTDVVQTSALNGENPLMLPPLTVKQPPVVGGPRLPRRQDLLSCPTLSMAIKVYGSSVLAVALLCAKNNIR